MTKRPLAYVTDFVSRIHQDLAEGAPDGLTRPWMSRAGEGTVFFSESDALDYSQVVLRLMDEHVIDEDMSRGAVESYVADAIFSALDLQKRRSPTFQRRLTEAVDELHRMLQQPPADYTCWVPVGGLEDAGLPSKFGRVRLVVMNETQLRRMSRPTGRQLPKAEAAQRRRVLNGVDSTDWWGQPAAVVTVRAKDNTAAGTVARREVRRAIDALNFFADLVPYNHGYLYLPGEAATVTTCAPVLGSDGGMCVPFSRSGPPQLFSLQKLRATQFLTPSFRRVHALMRETPESPMTGVFLAATQWAGRASVEPTREQAFLLYAIALETLMLPEDARQGLTYRLRIRVAHLLGRDQASRAALSAKVRDLYDIRSKVAHSGSYEVTEIQLSQMRFIVKQCILRALLHRRIRACVTPKEFAEWFEGRVLL